MKIYCYCACSNPHGPCECEHCKKHDCKHEAETLARWTHVGRLVASHEYTHNGICPGCSGGDKP